MQQMREKARLRYDEIKRMADKEVYDKAIGIIDQKMTDLRKKSVREALIFKA